MIFPHRGSPDDPESESQYNDFIQELQRVRELVNRVPNASTDRSLESVTLNLTAAERDEFRRLGNQLIVSSFKYRNFKNLSIILGTRTKLQSFGWTSHSICSQYNPMGSGQYLTSAFVFGQRLLIYS